MSPPPDLSAFDESTMGVYSQPDEPSRSPSHGGNIFDACNVGVVLRAVLFVEATIAVAAMFGSGLFIDWLLRFSSMTGGALPATLSWLIATCLLQSRLAKLPVAGQWAAGMALGALAGVYGCGLLFMMGLINPAPWVGSAFAGALLSAVLVAGLVWRTKARTPATTTARLAELQSRIRPHFLFNTLNSAIALVRAEPAKAEAVLEDLSELFRHALADQGEAVTLGQEIALAQRYMAIEQIRFGERLQVQWSLDPEAEPAKLPPLLLQPLVENAVRHGVEPSAAGAQIKISTVRRGSVVVLKVTNSTPAGAGERGHGLALANVRERLALLHDVQGRFTTAFNDGVFQVRLEIPL
jgi:two-component system sensor histidine kinase AlgZ